MKSASWKMALLSSVLLLSACGVEVMTTTATVGELKAEEAKNAQQQMEKAQEQLKEIQALTAQHNAALEAATGTVAAQQSAPQTEGK
jgi:Tfp pilus assembly protein FimV